MATTWAVKHLEMKLRQSPLKSLIALAVKGDTTALEFFRYRHKCKVYTEEEIYVLNKYILKDNGMDEKKSEIVMVEGNRIIELPELDGTFLTARLNWIKDIGEGYFRAGLSYTCGYPYDGASTEWVLKLDPEKGFIPMFCSMYWSPEDYEKKFGKTEEE